jgi:hypothetical protein
MNFSEIIKVLYFGGTVDFHMPLQVRFSTETAGAKRALAESIIVTFLGVFLVHYYTLFFAVYVSFDIVFCLISLMKKANCTVSWWYLTEDKQKTLMKATVSKEKANCRQPK